MIKDPADIIPIWMLLSAALGFIVGEACGDNFRHWKCLEQVNENLRDQLQNSQACSPTLQSALGQQRRVINDIHKRVVAVSKGLENLPR